MIITINFPTQPLPSKLELEKLWGDNDRYLVHFVQLENNEEHRYFLDNISRQKVVEMTRTSRRNGYKVSYERFTRK